MTTRAFKKIYRNVEAEYLGESVPKEYRRKYGKVYNKKDIKGVAIAIAKSRGIKI